MSYETVGKTTLRQLYRPGLIPVAANPDTELLRIRATVDSDFAKAGELGGYVSAEVSLVNSWVGPDAVLIDCGLDGAVATKGLYYNVVATDSRLSCSSAYMVSVNRSVIDGDGVFQRCTVDESHIVATSDGGIYRPLYLTGVKLWLDQVMQLELPEGAAYTSPEDYLMVAGLGTWGRKMEAYRTAEGVRIASSQFKGTLQEFREYASATRGVREVVPGQWIEHPQVKMELLKFADQVERLMYAYLKEGDVCANCKFPMRRSVPICPSCRANRNSVKGGAA